MTFTHNDSVGKANQFGRIGRNYSSFVRVDPIRNSLHYPAVIECLDSIRGKRVLDIGCGDGLFARKLAGDHGAKVAGYDKAPELIALARREEENTKLGIEYFVADPTSFDYAKRFNYPENFDYATSVMVLPYAQDMPCLFSFFRSAYSSIKGNGSFVSVTFNPNFKAFGEVVGNRLFEKLEDNIVKVNFLDPIAKEVKFSAKLMQFSKDWYYIAARMAGFVELSWKEMHPTNDGISTFDKGFWSVCEKEQPYSILRADCPLHRL